MHGQRLLGGEKGIQISSAIPMNRTDKITKNYSFQLFF